MRVLVLMDAIWLVQSSYSGFTRCHGTQQPSKQCRLSTESRGQGVKGGIWRNISDPAKLWAGRGRRRLRLLTSRRPLGPDDRWPDATLAPCGGAPASGCLSINQSLGYAYRRAWIADDGQLNNRVFVCCFFDGNMLVSFSSSIIRHGRKMSAVARYWRSCDKAISPKYGGIWFWRYLMAVLS